MIRALWRDGVVYALGTIIVRGLGLLLLPLYTRLLSPQQFGLLDLIVTAGVLVNLVVPLETPQAVARLWNERDAGEPRRRLAGTGTVFALAAYAVFVAAAWLAAESIARLLSGNPGDAGAVRAGCGFIAANGMLLVLQGQYRWALRPRAFAAVGIGYSLGVLGGFACLAALGATGPAAVLWVQATAAASVAAACAYDLRGDLRWRIDRDMLDEMLRFSLPLVPAGVALFATLNLHRFVLSTYAPLDEVGHYAVASRLAGATTLVLVGVQGALTPLVYAHHAEPDTPTRLARLFELFWGLSLLACLVLAVFARETLRLLTVPAYVDAAPLVAWLAPGALLAQLYVFAPGIPIAKKTLWQLALTSGAGVLGLVLALLLVPGWHASGAAVSAWAASAAFLAAWVGLGQRLYPLPLRWLPMGGGAAAYALLAMGAARLGSWPDEFATWVLKATLVAGLAVTLAACGLVRADTIVRGTWRTSRGR